MYLLLNSKRHLQKEINYLITDALLQVSMSSKRAISNEIPQG